MEDYSKKVRRKDRQATGMDFYHALLNNSVSCSIAIEKEGYPLIQVAFYAYDEPNNEIIFHFSKYGFGGQEITKGKKVCVSVYKYGKLYTARQAVDFGCEYQSIILYGQIRILKNKEEKMLAMQLFFDKFFKHIPQTEYEAFTLLQTNPINIARITVEDWFGKEHLVPDNALCSFYPVSNLIIK
ncbi:hypothetical protein AHMF7605_27375 [Adhaeribacter arboris]|uniref:Flavin mononucleotide-binding protein n=1 Tax=Adhaeribacter arboris TaxID=2072846 RepID=A0A2T2YN65_9BACT|nr:pyridoxamine 5'-phosphate oxidase family protein [Adhaeribacter arboris]PSR56950.1 hypothetical protein AHMF7605_27375 [Adhaeribacter arboris]